MLLIKWGNLGSSLPRRELQFEPSPALLINHIEDLVLSLAWIQKSLMLVVQLQWYSAISCTYVPFLFPASSFGEKIWSSEFAAAATYVYFVDDNRMSVLSQHSNKQTSSSAWRNSSKPHRSEPTNTCKYNYKCICRKRAAFLLLTKQPQVQTSAHPLCKDIFSAGFSGSKV